MSYRYQQGIFRPTNPQKYVGDAKNIIYRSSWELKLLKWCDRNPSVIKYASEELVIPYFSRADNKYRRYFTDMVIQYKHQDGSVRTCIVEVKPEVQTREPKKGKKRLQTYLKEAYDWEVNCDKWAAAKAYAEKNGMEFLLLTEYDLGIKKK